MRRGYYIAVLAFLLLLAACTSGNPTATAESVPVFVPTVTPTEESTEYAWDQLLSRDAIRPIYEPGFVAAGDAGYNDDELVMGVSIEDEAKAYPVGLLARREMVNDELAGIPILVTW